MAMRQASPRSTWSFEVNIELLDDTGKPIERLCAHPALYCPDEDTMLAQKLAIETDEESFRRIANRWPIAA